MLKSDKLRYRDWVDQGLGGSRRTQYMGEMQEPTPRNLQECFSSLATRKALCACGAIVDLDSNTVQLKQRLGKKVECTRCRNLRISEEMEGLERHFTGEEGEDQ